MAPRTSLVLVLGLTACLAACATGPRFPVLPAAPSVHLGHRPGGPIDAAAEPADDTAPARFLFVELHRFPHRVGRSLPLALQSSLAVVAANGTRAVRPASLLLSDARITPDGAPWKRPESEELFAANLAWRGLETAELNLLGPGDHALQLGVSSGPEGWTLSLRSSAETLEPAALLAKEPDPDAAPHERGDLLILPARALPPRQPAWLLVPSPWSEAWFGLALREVPVDERAASRFLAQREALLAARVTPDDAALDSTPLLVRALAHSGTRRSALAEIGRAHELQILPELALGASYVVQHSVATTVGARLAQTPPPTRTDVLLAVLEGLARLELDDEEARHLDGLLGHHFGALSARRDQLGEALVAAGPGADLGALIARENLALLRDPDADLRWRAWLWLRARQLSPEGYHPLAARKQRRAALDAAEADA